MSLRTIGSTLTGLALLLCAASTLAQDKPDKKELPAKPAQPGFEKLKTLVGEWTVVDELDAAKAEDKGAKTDTSDKQTKPAGQAEGTDASQTISYKLIAAGSVVHETMFVGTPHEMVTVYHLDGDDLMLTHYCAMGNQPRMKAEKSSDGSKIVFKFAGGTNLDPAKDGHMHDVTFTFLDANHIQQEWTFYADGKPTKTEKFDLMRKK
jgi:hypothetical protein